MKGICMSGMWKWLMGILVIAVLAGMALQFVSFFTVDRTQVGVSSPLISHVFHNLLLLVQGNRVFQGDWKPNREMIVQVRFMYGEAIDDPKVQVQAIERIEKTIRSDLPETWREKMDDALKATFPGKVDALMAMFKRLDRYNSWLDVNWARLLGMSQMDRESLLRAKRQEIFGEAAGRIWSEDQRAVAVSRVIEGLSRVKGAPLAEKLSFFEGSIRQAYGQEADVFIQSRQQQLLDRFLGLESVQADLGAMQPQERRQSLMSIRKAMGMDEATRMRLDALEKSRDERWGKGLAYLKERQRIVSTVQGETRNRMLDELRVSSFGPEAAIIASEEGAGFFRFSSRRVYGKN
jgi:hypothetical protein